MIDATTDADLAALERRDAAKAQSAPVRRRTSATLAMLPAAAPETVVGQLAVTASSEVVLPPHKTPDPVRHLQTARMGFVLAALLVCYWLWIRRKKV